MAGPLPAEQAGSMQQRTSTDAGMAAPATGKAGHMDTDDSDPVRTLAQQSDEPRKPPRWPWLVGGLALGLSIGVAVARHVMAVRTFFRAPGWGWAAAETLAQTVFRIQPRV